MGGECMLAVSISPSPPLKKVHFDVDVESELFQPTHTVCTPKLRTNGLKYRAPDARVDVSETLAPPSSVAKPNYDDSLRRVSVVLYQHIRRCEKRLRETAHLATSSQVSYGATTLSGEPSVEASMSRSDHRTESFDSSTVHPPNGILSGLQLSLDKVFDEEHFVSPQYKYTFVRLPTLHPLTYYRMDKVNCKTHIPSVEEIFRFCKNLFNRAQLSAECTIVCLIYIERLMERANIPLLGSSWKPIVLCGLLLSSKVWQDLSSWNVEISNIYPQFPLHCINRLERLFLHYIQWDLYISGSVYAKYYFALRSLTEKKDFRRRYNYTIKIDPPNSKRLEERSAAVKNELYSRSL
ncbi:cyclin-Y-like protein [Achlya hypogyna]|uniref:Cyclin-Y-like protein n=1 Tax=Achlya hypogyna TaxID=1202772 RepID=A0A1V9ZAD2_ACHHY|nr:cyclin-Y-like protein [Achlya hypogyna]